VLIDLAQLVELRAQRVTDILVPLGPAFENVLPGQLAGVGLKLDDSQLIGGVRALGLGVDRGDVPGEAEGGSCGSSNWSSSSSSSRNRARVASSRASASRSSRGFQESSVATAGASPG
jgi:hypothetical protein